MEESKTSLIQIHGNAVAEDQITDIESERTDEKPENVLDENEDFKVTLSTTVRENVRGFLESFVLKSKTENLNDTSKEESVNPEHEAELQISGDSSCNFNALEVNDKNVDKGEVKNSNKTDRDNKPGVSKDKTTIIEEIVIEKTYKLRNIAEITHGKHDIAENGTEERLGYESTSEKNFESRVLSSYNEIVGSDNGCKIAEIEHAKGNSQKDSRVEAEKTKSSEGTVRNTNYTGNEGRQGGVSNVEIIKQIASSEFANMNGLEKQDMTMLDDNSKKVHFTVENGNSTNEIQSTLEFGVNETNVKLQIEITDSTANFKDAKHINSLEGEKMHDVTHEITNISDPTAVNFHFFVTNDNHESTIQNTTHTVSQTNDENKDVMQIHIEDRASAQEGSRQDFAPEAEQTEDSDKVDTTVVEGIGKEIKASTKSDSKNNCIQCMSPGDFHAQEDLQLCINNSIYSIRSTNSYASPEIKTSATSGDDDHGMKNISKVETNFLSPADSKKDKSMYIAQDEYTSPEITTPDVELNTKSILSKVKAANQDFSLVVNNILFMKKDGTKLIEGVGDEIQLSRNDNRETFMQIKTQYDSQNICLTADKATGHVVLVMTENIDPSKQDELKQTDELPKDSQLSMINNIDESNAQCMTTNDFKRIDKASDELHLGMQNGLNDFETTEEDVSTKEENNTSGQGNASIVDGNTAQVKVVGTENRTRFVNEYNFKNENDEMQLDVRESANTAKEIKHDVCPKANLVANVSYIKQDAPLGLQADIECIIKTEVDISLENIDSAKTVESLIREQNINKDQKGKSVQHFLERSFLLSHNDTYSGLKIQVENHTNLYRIGDDMKGLESTSPEATEKELESDTEKKVIISTIEEIVCNSEKTQAINSNPNEENDSLHETARKDFSKFTSDNFNKKRLETTDLVENLENVSFYQISKDTHTSELFETGVMKAENNSYKHLYRTTDAGFNDVYEEDKYFSLLSENEASNRNCKDDHPKMELSKQTRKSSMQEKTRDKQYRNTETKTESTDYYMNTNVILEQPAETYKNKLKLTGHISTDIGTTKALILQGVEETSKEKHTKDLSVEFEELSQLEEINATNLDDNVAGCNRIVRKCISTDESNVNADTAKIDDARTEGSGSKHQNEPSEDVRLQDKNKYPNETRKVNKSKLENVSESRDNENGLQAINNSNPHYEKSYDETDNVGAGFNNAGDGEQMIVTNEKTKTADENDENNQYLVGNGTEIHAEPEDNDIHHEAQNNFSSYAEVSNLRIKNETKNDDRSMINGRLLALPKPEFMQMMPNKIYFGTDNDSKTPSDSSSLMKDASLNAEFTLKTDAESPITVYAIQITSSTSDDDNCHAPVDQNNTKTTVPELQLMAQAEEICPDYKDVVNVSANNGVSNYDEGKQSDRCLNINVEKLTKLPPNPITKNGNYGDSTANANPGLITISIKSIVTDYPKASDKVIKGSKTRFKRLNNDEHEAAEGKYSTHCKKYAIENSDELNKNETDERSEESENQVNIKYILYSDTGDKRIPENSAKIFDGKAKEENEHFYSKDPVRDDLKTQADKENMSYLIERKAIITANPDNREEIKYAAVTVEQSSTERAQDSWSLVQPETTGTNKSMEKENYDDINDAKNIGDTKYKNAIRNENINLCSHHDFKRSDPNDQESERKEEDNTKYVESDTANQSPNTAVVDGTTTIHENFVKAIAQNENNHQTGNEMETQSHLMHKDSVVEEDRYVYATKMYDPSTFKDNTEQADETIQINTVTSDEEISSSNKTPIDQKTAHVSCNSVKTTKELDSPDEQIQAKYTADKNKEKSATNENKSAADEKTNTVQTCHKRSYPLQAYCEMLREAKNARDFGSQCFGMDPTINEPIGQKISAEKSQFDQVATKELCITSEHGIKNVSNMTKLPSQATHDKDCDQTQNWDTSRQYVCKSRDAENDDNVDVDKYIDMHVQACIHTTLEHDETNKDISLPMQNDIQTVKDKPGHVKFFKPGIAKEKVDTGEHTLEYTNSIIPCNFYYKLTRCPSSAKQKREINTNLVGESINLMTLNNNNSQHVKENAEGRDDKIFAFEPYLVKHADGQAANDKTYECRFTIHTAIRSVCETGLTSIHVERDTNEDLNKDNLYSDSSTHDATNTHSAINGDFDLTEEDEVIVEIGDGTPVKIENTDNAEENINLYVPSYKPNKENVDYDTNHIKCSTKSVAKGNHEAAQVDGEINSIYKDGKKISYKEIHQNGLYVKKKRKNITEAAIIDTTNKKLFKDVGYEVHNDPTFKQYRNDHGIIIDNLAKKKYKVITTSKSTTETMSKAPTRWNTFQEISDENYQLFVEINSHNVDEATTQRPQVQMQNETDHGNHNCKGFWGSSQTATTSAEQSWKELDIRNENGDTMHKNAMDTYYSKTQFVTEMTTPRFTQSHRRDHLIDETMKSGSHYKNESQYSSAACVPSMNNHHVCNAKSNATAVEIPTVELRKHDFVKPELNEAYVSNNLRIYENQSANNVEIDNTLFFLKTQAINADVTFAIIDKELLSNTEKTIHDISHQNNVIDYDSSSQSKSKQRVNNICQSAKPHEEIKSLNITGDAELESGEIIDPRVNVSLYVNGDLSYKIPHENDIERQPTTQIIFDTTKPISGVQSTKFKTKKADKEHAKYVNHSGQGARDNRNLGICDYNGECERRLLSLETSALTEHFHLASESESTVHNIITNVSEMKSKPSINLTVPHVEESVETKEAKYFPYLSAVSRTVESSSLDIRTNDSLKRLIVTTSNETQYESLHDLPTGHDYPQNVGFHSMSVEREDSIVSNESLATNEVIRSKYLASKRYNQTPNDADDESETQPKEYKSDFSVEGDVQISEEGLDTFSIDSNSTNENEMHKNETKFRRTQDNVNEKERTMKEMECHIQQLSEDTDKARKSTYYIGMKMMDGNERFVSAALSKPSNKIQGNQNQQTSEIIKDIDSEDPWTNQKAKDVNLETNDAQCMLLNDDIDYRKTHQIYADPDRRCIKLKEEPSNEQEQLICVYHEPEEGNIPEYNMVRETGKNYIRAVTLHPGIPDILQDNDNSESDDKIEKFRDDFKNGILQNCTSTSKEILISKIKNDEPSKSLPTKLLTLVKDLKKTLKEETEMQLQYMSCLRSVRENITRGLEVLKPIRCDDERPSRVYDSESEYSTDTFVIYHEDDCSHSINQDEYSIGFEKSHDNDKFGLSMNQDKIVEEKDTQTDVHRFGFSSDSEVLESGRKVKKNIPTRYKEIRNIDKQMETNEEKEEHVRESQEFSDIIAYRDENEKLNKTKPCEKKSTEGTVLPSGNEGTVSEMDTKTPFASVIRKDTDAYMPMYHAPKRNPKIDSKWPSNHPAHQMLYRKQLSSRKMNIGALPHLKKNNINNRGQPPSPIKAVDPIHRCGAVFLPPIHHPTYPDTTDDIHKAKQYLEYLHNHPIPSKSKKTKGPLGNRRKEDISMSLPNLNGMLPLSLLQIHQELMFDPQPPTSPIKPFSGKELAEMEEYLELTQRKPYSPGKSFSSKQADSSNTFSVEDMVEIIKLRKTFYLGNRKEMDDYREHRINQIFRELQEIRKKTEEGKDILIIRKGVRPRSGRKKSENSNFIIFDYFLGEVEKMKTDEDL